mgnify:CR=1 FL=1
MFTRKQRAAIYLARAEVLDRLKCSEEAFLQLVRGGTTAQRSARLKAGRARVRSRSGPDGHTVELLYAAPPVLPRRDRALERALRNHWDDVLDGITPIRTDTGAKLRTPQEFRKALHA